MGSINESGHANVCPRLIPWMTCSWISVTIFFDKSLTCFSPKALEYAHINYKEQREPRTLKFLTRANSHRWPRPQGLLIGDAWSRRAAGSWTTTDRFLLPLLGVSGSSHNFYLTLLAARPKGQDSFVSVCVLRRERKRVCFSGNIAFTKPKSS